MPILWSYWKPICLSWRHSFQPHQQAYLTCQTIPSFDRKEVAKTCTWERSIITPFSGNSILEQLNPTVILCWKSVLNTCFALPDPLDLMSSVFPCVTSIITTFVKTYFCQTQPDSVSIWLSQLRTYLRTLHVAEGSLWVCPYAPVRALALYSWGKG